MLALLPPSLNCSSDPTNSGLLSGTVGLRKFRFSMRLLVYLMNWKVNTVEYRVNSGGTNSLPRIYALWVQSQKGNQKEEKHSRDNMVIGRGKTNKHRQVDGCANRTSRSGLYDAMHQLGEQRFRTGQYRIVFCTSQL